MNLKLNLKIFLDCWQLLNIKFLQADPLEVPLMLKQSLFKVENISDLRGLGHTSSVIESLPPVVSNRILSIVSEPTEKEVATDYGPRSSLTCVAVDHNHIFWVFMQKLLHGLADVE